MLVDLLLIDDSHAPTYIVNIDDRQRINPSYHFACLWSSPTIIYYVTFSISFFDKITHVYNAKIDSHGEILKVKPKIIIRKWSERWSHAQDA